VLLAAVGIGLLALLATAAAATRGRRQSKSEPSVALHLPLMSRNQGRSQRERGTEAAWISSGDGSDLAEERDSTPDSDQLEAKSRSDDRPDRERVLVQLADGRAIEGYKREFAPTQGKLLILDVIRAFDAKGNETLSSRADSFILNSEINSIRIISHS
jgi:hypothetical protein